MNEGASRVDQVDVLEELFADRCGKLINYC